MHSARTWFGAAWASYLQAGFPTIAAAARAFDVDERTARDWWHGRNAPSGVFVAHAFRLTPHEATIYLTGSAALSGPHDDLEPFGTAESRWPSRHPLQGGWLC